MDGTMVIDIIGTKKKVDVSWEYLTKEDMKTLAMESGSDRFSEIFLFMMKRLGCRVQRLQGQKV